MESAFELIDSAQPALVLLAVDERDERRALGLAAHAAGRPWVVLSRPRTDAPDELARADFGPQPLATLSAADADLGAALARVRAAMRGSVGAR